MLMSLEDFRAFRKAHAAKSYRDQIDSIGQQLEHLTHEQHTLAFDYQHLRESLSKVEMGMGAAMDEYDILRLRSRTRSARDRLSDINGKIYELRHEQERLERLIEETTRDGRAETQNG